jgi:hypothetical protein
MMSDFALNKKKNQKEFMEKEPLYIKTSNSIFRNLRNFTKKKSTLLTMQFMNDRLSFGKKIDLKTK